MKTVDCRNMACPAPVIAAKKAIEESGSDEIVLLVDEGAARENVSRFVTNRGCRLEETPIDKGFSLKICKPGAPTFHTEPSPAKTGGAVLLITSDKLGDGSDELGKILMKNFIITLLELPDIPARMIFLNSAVNLTTEGSEVAEPLSKLGEFGVEILSCGLCLDFYHKKDKLVVGVVTNMYNTAEALLGANSIIRI